MVKVSFKSGIQGTSSKHLGALLEADFVGQLKLKNPNLWGKEAVAEASERLGWIDALKTLSQTIANASAIKDRISANGINRVVLCGMGGSTLAAQLLSTNEGGSLIALDTTHPDEVAAAFADEQMPRTLVIVSTKSGSTVETMAQLAISIDIMNRLDLDVSKHLLVITDPGNDLHARALELGCELVLGDPHVGGRFSALTPYGVVPAVLAGSDLTRLDEQVQSALPQLFANQSDNPGLTIAAALFESMQEFATAQFVSSAGLELLPEWLEQLIAESTGKSGYGLLPIPRAADLVTEFAGPIILCNDSQNLHGGPATISIAANLGSQILLWEIVTVAISFLQQVNPFDQPDVERTKQSAREMLAGTQHELKLTRLSDATSLINLGSSKPFTNLEAAVSSIRSSAGKAKYILVQAFIDENEEAAEALEQLATELEMKLKKPVALSFGPRYLHSTGQMHKGGPGPITVLQIMDQTDNDIQVPNASYTLADLQESWLLADKSVHQESGNTVLSIHSVALKETITEVLRLL